MATESYDAASSLNEFNEARAPEFVPAHSDIQIAQVEPAAIPPAAPPMPQVVVVRPDAENRISLAMGTSLESIVIEGDNIVLVQPDGTRLVIEGGALDIPTFVIDDVEIPQEALIAAFETKGIDVAAGPDGLSIVSSPNSSGGNFGEAAPGIGEAGPAMDLLAPTALAFDGPEQPELVDNLNIAPEMEFLPGGVLVTDATVFEAGLEPSATQQHDGTDEPNDTASGREYAGGGFQLSDANGIADIESITITTAAGQVFTIPIASLNGAVIQGAHGTLAFQYFPATGFGIYQYKLTEAIAHTDGQGPGTAQNVDVFTITVSDGVLSSPPATLNIDIVDDVPHVTVSAPEGAGALSLELDETEDSGDRYNGAESEDAGGNANTDDAGPGLARVSTAIEGGIATLFGINAVYGADGPAAGANGIVTALSFTGLSAGQEVATNLTATGGGPISLVFEGGKLVGKAVFGATTETVFEIEITGDQASGYQLQTTLYKAIDHGADGNLFDSEAVLKLVGDGAIGLELTVTIQDGDGDTSTDSKVIQIIDQDGSVVSFDDDGPKLLGVTSNTGGGANGFFFDGFVPNGNSWGIDSGVNSSGSSGPWSFTSNGGSGAVQLERVGDGYLGMHSSTNGFMIDLDATPHNVTVSQTLNLADGAHYTLSFEAGSPAVGDKHLEVWFGGQKILDFDPTGPMTVYNYDLVGGAGDGSNRLEFRETGAPDNFGTFLANVSIDGVTVIDDEDTSPAGNQGDPANGDDGSGAIATGQIRFDAGSDGLGQIAFSGPQGVSAIYVGPNGVGTAEAVTYQFVADGQGGGTLYGFSAHFNTVDNPAFTLTVEADGGYTFTLYAPLQHAAPAGSSSFENNLLLDFGVTITDRDGDSVSGSLNIEVDDDSPTITSFTVKEGAALIHDETPGVDAGTNDQAGSFAGLFSGVDIKGSDPHMPPAYAQIAGSALFTTTVSYGADGAQAANALIYALSLGSSWTGLQTTDGRKIELFLEDGIVVGRYEPDNGQNNNDPDGGGWEPAAFAVHIDPVTGTVTVVQYVSLKHPDGSDANDVLTLPAGSIKVTASATDGDGDTDAETVNIGGVISFRDDGPTLTTAAAQTRTVDEDDIDSAYSKGTSPDDDWMPDGSYTGSSNYNAALGGPAYVHGSAGGMVNFGADGKGGFSLAPDAVSYFNGLDLSSKGRDLAFNLTSNGGWSYLTATTSPGGQIVFEFRVNQASGDYEFRLYDQLDHDAPPAGTTADQNSDLRDGVDDDQPTVLDFGSIIRATDGDGDFIDLDGLVKITVTDDVPELIADRRETATADEDDIATLRSVGTSPNDGNSDGSYTGSPAELLGGPAVTSGSLGHVVRSGADEGLTFSFVNEAAARTALTALGLTSDQRTLSFDIQGNVLYGFINNNGSAEVYNPISFNPDQAVFKLTLNADGTYKFELYDQLDHPAGEGENELAINFGRIVRASDYDGDSVVLDGAFDIIVRDDTPKLTGAKVGGVVEEEDLPGGNEDTSASPDLDADFPLFGGIVQLTTTKANGVGLNSLDVLVQTGADNPGKFAFNVAAGADLGSLTSEGKDVKVGSITSGSDLFGAYQLLTAVNESGTAVFTLKVYSDGDWTFNLLNELDHPEDGNVESVLDLDLSGLVKFTDEDGDVLTFPAGSFVVKVIDDVPVLTGQKEIKFVNEDDINTSWSTGTSPHGPNATDPENDGDNSHTLNEQGPNDPAYTSGSLAGLVRVGADNHLTFGFSAGAIAALQNLHLFSKQTALPENGKELTYTLSPDGTTITAYEPNPNGNKVFELKLDPATGNYEFRLYDELVHKAGDGGESTILRSGPDGQIDGIDFGSIIEATDGDGDSIALTGNFIIKIIDDVPVANISLNSSKSLVIDETPGANHGTDDVPSWESLPFALLFSGVSNKGDDPDVNTLTEPAIGYAYEGSPLVSFSSQTGADAPAAASSLSLAVTGGPASGLFTTEGQPILLYKEGNYIVGRVGSQEGAAAFAIHMDQSGRVAVVQYLSLKHGDTGNANDQVDLSGKISAVVSVTDSDGDTATASVDIGGSIRFLDDGPSVSISVRHSASLVLDESLGTGGSTEDEQWLFPNNNDEAASADPTDIGYAKISAGNLFSLSVNGGSDGVASTVFALTVANANSGLIHTASGQQIVLSIENGAVVGKAGSTLVFKIEVNAATGAVEVKQYEAIKHNDPSDHDESYPSEALLGQGKIGLTVTVTDGDGDTASDSLDLGKLIRFEDDGPKITQFKANNVQFIHDETPGDQNGADNDIDPSSAMVELFSSVGNKGQDNDVPPSGAGPIGYAQISGATLFSTSVDFGTDQAHASTAYKFEFVSGGQGWTETGLKTTEGRNIKLSLEKGILVGRYETGGDNNPDGQGDEPAAFALHIDPATGTITLVQYVSLNHGTGGDPNNLVNFMRDRNVTVKLTVTDGDGDTDSESVQIGSKIGFRDDGPQAFAGDVLTVLEEAGSTNGSNLLANDIQGADGARVTHVIFDGTTHAVHPVNGVTVTTANGAYTFSANGDWTFDPLVNAANANTSETFTYRITDGDGDVSEATQLVVIENANTLPTAGETSAVVDDEGLPNGIPGHGAQPDDVPGEAATASGTLPHDFNADGQASADPISFAAMDGTSGLVGTETVNYSWDGANNTLTATSSRGPIFTVQVDGGSDTGTGNYTFTLLKPVLHAPGAGENDAVVELTYTVTDSDGDSAPGKLSITIDDDTPVAKNAAAEITIGAAQSKANVVLIIDTSGSMDDILGTVKTAIQDLFNSGKVNAVQIYTFASNGHGPHGGGWYTDLSSAYNNVIAGLTASGETDYDAALHEVMKDFTQPPAGGDSLVSLFLSDGKPTEHNGTWSEGIDEDDDDVGGIGEETAWINFLTQNGFSASYAFGFGSLSNGDRAELEPIAWQPNETADDPYDADNSTGLNDPNVIITDVSNLGQALQTAVGSAGSGNLLQGAAGEMDDPAFGADGAGHVGTLRFDSDGDGDVDGNDDYFTFDGTASQRHNGDGSPDGAAGGAEVTFTTGHGGALTFNFVTGAWEYQTAAQVGAPFIDRLTYTLVDGDGDESAPAAFDIKVQLPPPTFQVSDAAPVTEGGQAEFKITLQHASLTPIAFNLTLGAPGDTAESGDYGPGIEYFDGTVWQPVVGNQVTVPAGATELLIRVQTNEDDADYSDETFTLTATAAVAGTTANASDAGAATILDDDTPPNQAPEIKDLGSSVTFTEGDRPVRIDRDVDVTDSDSADFAGGSLTVAITQDGETTDRLTINEGGNIEINGNEVRYNPPGLNNTVTIGTWTGGTNGAPLVITLNGNATPDRVEELMERIEFENTSNDPSGLPREVTFTLNDGDGGTGTATTTVTVNPVNSAPVLSNVNIPSITLNEDAPAPAGAVGTLVSSLVDPVGGGGLNNVTDADGDGPGIALTGASSANGTWYFSIDNGASWTAVGPVGSNNALLLSGDARLYFQPNANYNGGITNALTFRAWDETSGVEGSKVNTNSNGGTTAFSSATDTVNVTVNPINDAPTSTNDSLSMNGGTPRVLTVGDFGAYHDVEGTPLAAIQISSLPGNGQLQYSANGSTGWTAVADDAVFTVSDINAGRLRFVSDPGESGSSYASIGFKVGDGTSFSADAYELTINVNAVPVAGADNIITNAGALPFAVPEWALLLNDSDNDGQALDITAITGPNGLLANLTNPGFVTVTDTAPNGGSFGYTISDGVTTAGGSATVSQQEGDTLEGTSGNDIVIAGPAYQVTKLSFAPGGYDAGDKVSITLNGKVYTYTVPAGGQSAEQVYDGLKATVPVGGGVALASALATLGVNVPADLSGGSDVTLQASTKFEIAAATDNSADVGKPWIYSVDFDNSIRGFDDPSENITITIGGQPFTGDAFGSGSNTRFDNAAGELVGKLNAAGFIASYDQGTNTFTIQTTSAASISATSTSNDSNGTVNTVQTGAPASDQPSPGVATYVGTPQTTTIGFDSSYDVGDKVSITVDSVTYTHTVAAGATSGEQVYDALKSTNVGGVTLANSLLAKGVTWPANLSGNSVTLMSYPGVVFALTTAISNAWVYEVDFDHGWSLSGFGNGEEISITIEGTTYTAAGFGGIFSSSDSRFDDAASNLLPQIQSSPGVVSASYDTSTNTFTIRTNPAAAISATSEADDGGHPSVTVKSTTQQSAPSVTTSEATDGDMTLIGNEGDDVLIGGIGDDTLEGGDGDDYLIGGDGGDTLEGGLGNDYLDGGAGDDTLEGGDGDDILIGGPGRDNLTGGDGADTFVIDAGAIAEGPELADLITDYSISDDSIDLTSLLDGIASGADLTNYVRTVEGGDGARDALQVNTTGSGNEADFVTVAILDANAGVKILYNDDQQHTTAPTV